MHASGTCRILYCFDVAREINLAAAATRLADSRRVTFAHKGRTTAERPSAPLRGVWNSHSTSVGPWRTEADCDLSVYASGAVAITFRIDLDCAFEDLVQLSSRLYDNPELLAQARLHAEQVLAGLGTAADSPKLAEIAEDYVCFTLGPWRGRPDDLDAMRNSLARVLRAEPGALSQQEVDDALSDHVSYLQQDTCMIDWLGALVFGVEVDDELLVLELANVELLQLRLLDQQLDGEVNEAYRVLSSNSGLRAVASKELHLHRIGRMQAEGAVMHEGIDNALKLFGDDYLARLYRTAAERFHFNELDASIQRKLGVLRGIYESASGLAAHRRSEALEWIIIILIGVEIVLHFVPGA